MTLAREIAFILGALTALVGVACFDYRVGMIAGGVALSLGCYSGMKYGRNR